MTSFGVKWDILLAFFEDLGMNDSVLGDDHFSQQESAQRGRHSIQSLRQSFTHKLRDNDVSNLPELSNKSSPRGVTADVDPMVTIAPLVQSHRRLSVKKHFFSHSKQVSNATEIWDEGASTPMESTIHHFNADDEVAFSNIYDAQLTIAHEEGHRSCLGLR